MSDTFLEEQLQRIRQLTERMSQVMSRREQEEAARERSHSYGPLQAVRDVRVISSVPPKASASDSAPRRQRRRRR